MKADFSFFVQVAVEVFRVSILRQKEKNYFLSLPLAKCENYHTPGETDNCTFSEHYLVILYYVCVDCYVDC